MIAGLTGAATTPSSAEAVVLGRVSGEASDRVRATPPSGHITETATAGPVVATLSYSYDPNNAPPFSNVQVMIDRSGQRLLNVALVAPNRYGDVEPADYYASGKKSVFVQDLDGDGEPEIFLSLYWGGAHCCYYTYLYRYAAGTYQRVYHLWGDPTYTLRDLNGDGRPEFASADDRFAYAFTDFADSGFPVQIWSYQAGRFANVTRSFPLQVRRDAAAQWRYYSSSRREHRSPRGVLAAWAADECLLGRSAAAFRTLKQLARQGRLKSQYDIGGAQAYVRKLKTFLRKNGYRR
jgi:hypothetical protein